MKFKDKHFIYLNCFPVTQLCPTLCDPMDYSTSVLHCLPGFAQTHVHWVNDAIQPSHPLSSPTPPAFNLYQHQSLFQWISSSIRWPKYWSFSLASVLPMNIQGLFPLGWTGLSSLQSKGLSRVFCSTIVWNYQLFGAQPSLRSNSHFHIWLVEHP